MAKNKKNEWMEWTKAIIIALFISFLLKSFVFATSVVQGQSMLPTLSDGERLLFNKLIYLVDEPDRGDIVIIQRPIKNYVKRIIALPNEVIAMRNEILYIDGIPYKQTFLNSKNKSINTNDFGPIKIPPNSYFVMGDNRPVSKDSRNGLGFIIEEEIIGRAEFVIYPLSEWSIIR